MGTYYRYVNYTRKEYVGLSDLQDVGNKEMALVWCAPALAWLMMPQWMRGDGYCGRWAPDGHFEMDSEPARAHDIRVVPDYDGWDHLDDFVNISPGVLQSMRGNSRTGVEDWKPRCHDVQLVQRVRIEGALAERWELADKVSATCKCGWKVGPIFGDNREHVLELAVSEHVEG